MDCGYQSVVKSGALEKQMLHAHNLDMLTVICTMFVSISLNFMITYAGSYVLHYQSDTALPHQIVCNGQETHLNDCNYDIRKSECRTMAGVVCTSKIPQGCSKPNDKVHFQM